MGKLNYTNRKNEGLRLGQFIVKDLVRRIPPGLGYRSAVRDPVVEIDVSGKSLGDDGLGEVVEALIACISHNGPEGKLVRLEEICLKGNNISAASLPGLASVVRLARHEIRDIDLSENEIQINSRAEALNWEKFLRGFSGCCVLRRIDMSSNPLGNKAFEILSKVYAQEDPIDLSHFSSKQEHDLALSSVRKSVGNNTKAQYGNLESRVDYQPSETEDISVVEPHKECGSKWPEKSDHTRQYVEKEYAVTRGLRSVPYLVFSNTSMDDASALHLSYILEAHHTPERLLRRVPPAKAGPSAQLLASYDTETRCRGIIYLPNSTLGNAGLKALDLSEIERCSSFETSDRNEDSENYQTPNRTSTKSRRGSAPRISPAAMALINRRRASGLSNEDWIDTEMGKLDINELDWARSRIQGDTLESAGPKSNDLWQSALQTLSYCRIIQPQTQMATLSPLPLPEVAVPATPAHDRTDQLSSPPRSKGPIIRTLTIPGFAKKDAKPISSSTTALEEACQIASSLSSHRRNKSCITWIPDPPTPPQSPGSLKDSHGRGMLSRHTEGYRSNLPKTLPREVWGRIIEYAVGVDGILTPAQQDAILNWGIDRNTLRIEREYSGKKKAVQIWRVLNAIGCLAYEKSNR